MKTSFKDLSNDNNNNIKLPHYDKNNLSLMITKPLSKYNSINNISINNISINDINNKPFYKNKSKSLNKEDKNLLTEKIKNIIQQILNHQYLKI